MTGDYLACHWLYGASASNSKDGTSSGQLLRILPGHRMTTGSGGVIYQWRSWERVRGSGRTPSFSSDLAESVFLAIRPPMYEPGAGADVLAWRRFSVRVEYVYQFWPDLFGHGTLNPNGFTVGGSTMETPTHCRLTLATPPAMRRCREGDLLATQRTRTASFTIRRGLGVSPTGERAICD